MKTGSLAKWTLAGLLCASAPAMATPFGSDTVNFSRVTLAPRGASLAGIGSVVRSISFGSVASTGQAGFGPLLSSVAQGTRIKDSGTLYLSGTFDPAKAFTFTISGPSGGTFTQTAPVQIPFPPVRQFAGLYLVGEYTPTGSLASYASDFGISLTDFGSYSASGSFEIPPSAVPEPAGIALLGTGLFVMGLVRRKRR